MVGCLPTGAGFARLHFTRDVDLLHHTSAEKLRIDPALDLTRRQDPYFATAVVLLTLPWLPFLKSRENCSFLSRRLELRKSNVQHPANSLIAVIFLLRRVPVDKQGRAGWNHNQGQQGLLIGTSQVSAS